MRRAGGCAAAIFAVACGNHSGSGAFPGAGSDAGVDAHLDAASVADEGADGDAFAGSDAAILPECDPGKTCALPLVCDESDLLCEPACDATHPCGTGTFCRLATPGALDGNCIGPDYECLGHVPAPPAPTATYLALTTVFMDVSSGSGVPAVGLTVNACAKTDAPCAAPVGTAMTGPSGSALLEVPAGTVGFDGYLDVTGPSGDGGAILETLVFSSEPVLADGAGPTTNVTTAAALQQSVAPLGALDPTRAQVLIFDEACRMTPSFGASIAVSSADGATKVGYVGPAGIAAGASSFPVNAEALAYAVNVPGPTTTLTTTYGGETVNALDVVLRPGVLVTAYLTASPLPSQ